MGLQRKVTPFASRVLEQRRAQALEDGKAIDKLDSEELHQLRIDCKKLRGTRRNSLPRFTQSGWRTLPSI